MKTNLLLLATFLFVGFGMQASTFETDNSSKNNYYNDYGDSFTFVERNVTFAIFQNGEFDFYINPRNQRGGFGVNYQGNGVNISFNSGYNYDAYVQYDDYGAIIQVEDIPIYYDYYGRVTRVGNTEIYYNSGRLVRVGGLHVYYDRQGYYSHYSGYINSYNRNYVFHPYHNYFSRPLFDFRIVSYNPYRNHYNPTRYTYYSDHSRNKYYKNNDRRSGNDSRHRVASKSVPNRYDDRHNDKSDHIDRRNSNDRSGQNGHNNSINNTDRRSNTVNRGSSNDRTSQNSNNTDRRSNTVDRPSSSERTSQSNRNNSSVNNADRRTNTVNRPSQNERSSNSGRIAENRAPERTAKAPERAQQKSNSGNVQRSQASSRASNGKSDKKENSRGNSSRRN